MDSKNWSDCMTGLSLHGAHITDSTFSHIVAVNRERSVLLTLLMLNELRCHAHFRLSANQILDPGG